MSTFPKSAYDLAEVLTQLGTGEAIVTVLSERGAPSPVAWTRIPPPRSLMAQVDAAVSDGIVKASPLLARYGPRVDRESAYEMLLAKVAVPPRPHPPAPPKAPAPAPEPEPEKSSGEGARQLRGARALQRRHGPGREIAPLDFRAPGAAEAEDDVDVTAFTMLSICVGSRNGPTTRMIGAPYWSAGLQGTDDGAKPGRTTMSSTERGHGTARGPGGGTGDEHGVTAFVEEWRNAAYKLLQLGPQVLPARFVP